MRILVALCLLLSSDIIFSQGLRRPKNWKLAASWDDRAPRSDLPTSFDWEEFVALQPVRNQGSCGSCWGFGVAAVTESLYRLVNFADPLSQELDLSEQELVSCSRYGSCSGGFFTAFNYIRDRGLASEEAFPYKARNLSCKSGLSPIVKIRSWSYIGDGESASIEQIKTAIYNHGPIVVDINGSLPYESGVYTRCGSTNANHMVMLSGWTDDPKYAANGGGYWHMKNSWGTNWGMDGKMHIVYRSTRGSKCNGIAQTAAYAVLPETTGLDLRSTIKSMPLGFLVP